MFDLDERDYEADELRAEARAERRREARMRHWCTVCHGNLGPGSPCAPEEDEPAPDDAEDDE